MAVISNNLANTNTTGFKAGRAAFQDLMYQNIRQVGAERIDAGRLQLQTLAVQFQDAYAAMPCGRACEILQ